MGCALLSHGQLPPSRQLQGRSSLPFHLSFAQLLSRCLGRSGRWTEKHRCPSASVVGALGSGFLGTGLDSSGTGPADFWAAHSPPRPGQGHPAKALPPPSCLSPDTLCLGSFPGMGITRILGNCHLCPWMPPRRDSTCQACLACVPRSFHSFIHSVFTERMLQPPGTQ